MIQLSKDGPYLGVTVGVNITFLSQEMEFVLANSADLDEMPHYVAFHLGLHC